MKMLYKMFCKVEYNNQNIAILTPESKPQNKNKHQKMINFSPFCKTLRLYCKFVNEHFLLLFSTQGAEFIQLSNSLIYFVFD